MTEFNIGDRVRSSLLPGQTGIVEDISGSVVLIYYGLADYVYGGERILRAVPIDTLEAAP